MKTLLFLLVVVLQGCAYTHYRTQPSKQQHGATVQQWPAATIRCTRYLDKSERCVYVEQEAQEPRD